MPDKGWHSTFDDSIPLPDGGELRTLRDVGNYIAALPKGEHDTPAWRVAIPLRSKNKVHPLDIAAFGECLPNCIELFVRHRRFEPRGGQEADPRNFRCLLRVRPKGAIPLRRPPPTKTINSRRLAGASTATRKNVVLPTPNPNTQMFWIEPTD